MSKSSEEKRRRRAKRVAKREQRRERLGFEPHPTGTESAGSLRRIDGPAPRDGEVRIGGYVVTAEPMKNPDVEALPAAVREEIAPLLESEIHDWQAALPWLERAVELAPNIPRLYNLLTVAYVKSGYDSEARSLIVETYGRFPNYLFGLFNRISLAVTDRRFEDADAILQGRTQLREFAPQREVFHFSELREFARTMIAYHVAQGDFAEAIGYMRTLIEIEDEFEGAWPRI